MTPSKAASAPPLRREPVLVDLALQGGGAHGAFTWGVLDRLLEEPWLEIEAISGTSAGAMNAAVLADGHAAGGAEGARAALERFWSAVSRAALLSPLRRTPLDVLLGRWSLDFSPAFIAMDLAARLVSPYELNPAATNPLADVLAEVVDFDRLARAPIRLFVTATNVRTGQGEIFENASITSDVLLASACLPSCSRRWRSTARPIGMAAIPATRPSRPLVRDCASDGEVDGDDLVGDQADDAVHWQKSYAGRRSCHSTRGRGRWDAGGPCTLRSSSSTASTSSTRWDRGRSSPACPAVRDDVTARLVTLEGARPVRADHGAVITAQGALSERPDVLVVPGGGWFDRGAEGAWGQAQRGELPRAIAARHAAGTVVASVCTGALLLAHAGILAGHRATTNRGALDDLRGFDGVEVVTESTSPAGTGDARVVDDGDVVTAGGPACGLDLALALVERFGGAGLAEAAAAELHYERPAAVV